MKRFMTPYFADLIACDYESDEAGPGTSAERSPSHAS
jgi:hypothetical protein